MLPKVRTFCDENLASLVLTLTQTWVEKKHKIKNLFYFQAPVRALVKRVFRVFAFDVRNSAYRCWLRRRVQLQERTQFRVQLHTGIDERWSTFVWV